MIKSYLDPEGNTLWEVYVNIRSKTTSVRAQKRIKSLKTESLAQKIELQLIRDCERQLLKKEASGILWSQLLEKFELYMRSHLSDKISLIARNDYMGTLHKHTKHWMNREAAGLTSFEMIDFFKQLPDEMTTKHRSTIKMLINKVFRYGIDAGLLSQSIAIPTAGIFLKKEEDIKQEILTLNEIRKLLSAAKKMEYRWYPIWAFALLTGMRNGELFALTWDDIDFENRSLTVSKSYNKRLRITKSTKSGYWRTIPMSPELEILSKELKLTSAGSPFVLPRIRDWGKGYQAKELRQFCLSIGLPSIKFHALRACFATQLIRQGIPPIQIQKICGWKDLETMQRYIRLAGIEVVGVTDRLKIMPDAEVMGEVVNLFRQ